jgi:hypothetical protein
MIQKYPKAVSLSVPMGMLYKTYFANTNVVNN